METIDSHMHLWKLANGFYDWPTAEQPLLYRDFAPIDYENDADTTAIQRCILVQAAPNTLETAFLLELAHAHARIAGVVGWIDISSPCFTQNMDALLSSPTGNKLVGVRPMLQDMAQRDWILDHIQSCDALIERHLSFDALIRHDQIPVITELARRIPHLPIVLDHAGKPPFGSALLSQWQDDIKELAAQPNVMCKLSGLLTELPQGSALCDPTRSLTPHMAYVVSCFGPERTMWGSDWPVLTTAASLEQWWTLTTHFLSGLPADQQAKILGGTAHRFYHLKDDYDEHANTANDR